MNSLFLLISIMLFLHLSSRKKDAFFFFRSFGYFLMVPILTYFILIKLNLENDLIYYSGAFLFLSFDIFFFKLFRSKDLKFFIPTQKDFYFKKTLIFFILFLVTSLAALSFYDWQITAPKYFSVDPAVHFMQFRMLIEGNLSGFPGYASLYPLYNFFFNNITEKNLLFIYQAFNIFLFSLTSLYFFYLSNKFLRIKSKPLIIFAYISIVLGFFFNFFIAGFLLQSIGLYLLIFFTDLITSKKLNIYKTLLLILLFLSILVTYIYWIAPIILFFALAWFRRLILSPNKKVLLLQLMPILAISIYLVAKNKYLFTYVAIQEGETYKALISNFILLIPFFFFGLFLLTKKWIKQKNELATFFFASLIFSIVLLLAYLLDLASSYTFAKSIYLSGPIIFFISIYALDNMIRKLDNPKHLVKTSFLLSSFILVLFSFYILKPIYQFDRQAIKQELYESHTIKRIPKIEKNLLKSVSKDALLDFTIKPFDIFFFNANLYLYQKYNLMENFPYLNKNQLTFITNIQKELPPNYKIENFNPNIKSKLNIIMPADFKTSRWIYVLTGIWNPAVTDAEKLYSIVFDLDQWKKENNNPYILIIDSQTANKWLWLNQEAFNIENFELNKLYLDKSDLNEFEIIIQENKNYLLKYK